MSLEVNMQIEPRPYQDAADLDKMCLLLQAGRKANNGTYYIHIGDLKWWLFYPAWEYDPWQQVYLWDDPVNPERLAGWALLSPRWGSFDVYIQPELRGIPQAESMYTWAEGKLAGLRRADGKKEAYVMWVSQADKILDEHLQRRGFQRTPDDVVYMSRSLADPLPIITTPAGYTVRSSAGEIDAQERARAQYGAFESTLPFDIYTERIRRFMQSPVYDPDLNVVAVTPDGRIGSFCTVWPDPLNKVGLFEPVGTHPDHKRRGLGKVVMSEAMRRLREHGMTGACVCTSADNTPAVKLYESAGFRIVDMHLTYKKEI
jgi:GNAT superfamily N-acetyltransferase